MAAASSSFQHPEIDLSRFLAANYLTIKASNPDQGRRRWRLHVADIFFALSAEEKARYGQFAPVPEDEADEAPYSTDDDPFDEVTLEAPGLAVLIRTDFSNETAWQEFVSQLKEAEAEFAEGVDAPMNAEDKDDAGEAMDEDEDEDEGVSEEALDPESIEPAPIFHIINPASSTPLRSMVTGISNLTALRLLNDVDVRRISDPPAGTKRVKSPNRLVDYHGWQEVYTGKLVWVYDERSNADKCVRLVSQKSASMYGTVTADSWRARVSHICELQVNLASGAMSIDFGGLDRWDYPERVRNMTEAEQNAA